MTQKKLPILLTTFSRLDTTLQVIQAIREYQPEKIYISSDAGRSEKFISAQNTDEKTWVENIRNIILDHIDWECEIHTLFFADNQGCGKAISQAITWFFNHEEQGIILEDDCLPNQSFFSFCEKMLKRYKDTESIFMVSGWSAMDFIPKEKNLLKEDYFFSKYNHIWGWASWRRAWNLYQKNYSSFEEDFKSFTFCNQSERKFWHQIFKNYEAGKIDTWDYPWTFTIWKNKGLSIYPKNNMITNIGFNRDDATHTTGESKYQNMHTYPLPTNLTHPQTIEHHSKLDAILFQKVINHLPLLLRILNKITYLIFKKRFFL